MQMCKCHVGDTDWFAMYNNTWQLRVVVFNRKRGFLLAFDLRLGRSDIIIIYVDVRNNYASP